MNICASDASTRLLAGSLTETETAAFEDHLEVCPQCRERLEQEAGGEAAWNSARELLNYESPRIASWVSDVDGISERSTSESEWLPACTSSVVLSIVSPSDDPEFIGRIGSYEISGVIGRGSAGIVLRGFDRALHRNVAIKILDPAMAGVGAARQRFAREARAMAAISHEHVVPVYEVNEHAGLPFFVMEYVPGGSLERRLRTEGPFDIASVIRIGLQTAQALAIAHAQGLVHRDIKPGNILLDRGTERVRVADFGLVRVSNDVSCTRSGFIAGTPQYMAPEQVKAERCDGRSDLFSLGSLMYALCTGHAPFRADTIYGVMQRIVHDEPRSIRESNSLVPEWLEDFILRLMSKQRDDRFATADEVGQILQAELANLQNPGQTSVNLWSCRKRQAGSEVHKRRRVTFPIVRRWMLVSVAIMVLTVSLTIGFTAGLWKGLTPTTLVVTPTSTPTSSHSPNPVVDEHFQSNSKIVLWDDDGMEATRIDIKEVLKVLHREAETGVTDLWDWKIETLRQRSADMMIELEDTSIKPSPESTQ